MTTSLAPRRRLARLMLLAAVLAVGLSSAAAGQSRADPAAWVGTWSAAPAGPLPMYGTPLLQLNNQTLRLIVHTTRGGDTVRIRLSNTFGAAPVLIGRARLAVRAKAAAILGSSDHALTFNGKQDAVIPVGGAVVSDPIAFPVAPQSDLAISLYLPKGAELAATHPSAFQASYISPPTGDHAAETEFPVGSGIDQWPLLTEVEVTGGAGGFAIVCLGDSITNGSNTSFEANRRWPDLLAARLQAAGIDKVGVLNKGIGGNRLLRPGVAKFGQGMGQAGLARFDRDVLAQAGVRHVIVLLGTNDILMPAGLKAPEEAVTAEAIIAGLRQLIGRAHARGVKIYGGTIIPLPAPGVSTAQTEQERQAVNHWIRTSGAFDAVIDFDAAIRDPARPGQMAPGFDSGDGVHPTDAGMKVMAAAVDLRLFGAKSAN